MIFMMNVFGSLGVCIESERDSGNGLSGQKDVSSNPAPPQLSVALESQCPQLQNGDPCNSSSLMEFVVVVVVVGNEQPFYFFIEFLKQLP